MGNHIVVLDKDRYQVASINASLACFCIVKDIIEKYNPRANIWNVENINKLLGPVYGSCEGYEEVQLLLFINDKSNFDEDDIPKFNKAIDKYTMKNDGPKRVLIFVRDLLKKHKILITEYTGTTMAMTITKSGKDI